jgi:methyl-accepting chemotaxis protein
MKWFYDLKIATKLAMTFLVVLVLTSALGFLSITQLNRVNGSTAFLSDRFVPALQNAYVLQINALRIDRDQQLLAQEQATGIPTETRTRLDQQLKRVTDLLSELKSSVTAASAAPHLIELEKQVKQVQATNDEAMKAFDDRKIYEGIDVLMNQSPVHAENLIKASRNLSDDIIAQSAVLKADAQAVYQSGLTWIIALLAIAFVACTLLGIFIARSISVPLRIAANVADRVAGGDLTVDIQPSSKDESGKLLESLKVMNEGLHKVVMQIRQGAETIKTASTEIAAGNMDLSSRTEQQASSLEETASAMEELTTTVKQNADNAKQANQLAASASQIAIEGGTVVEKVVATMDDINNSSKKIVDIISVIDGIAFQTNILALNAAVEAARAGEQGRGFAVVASEVRNLAQRSASAAKEIKELIDDSVSKVDIGSRLVGEAGSTMEGIVDSIRRVTDIVAEISAASQEQSSGIEEVNRAITQMDEATQQNAALVEQATAATQSLLIQADELGVAVNSFKVDRRVANMPTPATKKPAPKVQPTIKPIARAAAAPAPVTRKPTPTPKRPPALGNESDSWEEF